MENNEVFEFNLEEMSKILSFVGDEEYLSKIFANFFRFSTNIKEFIEMLKKDEKVAIDQVFLIFMEFMFLCHEYEKDTVKFIYSCRKISKERKSASE